MKTASDYPITFPYGATTPPYSPAHPHLGDDRSMPIGTPIVVNGQTIGLSGNTGHSTGPHEHTQEVKDGMVVKPEGGGYEVPGPVVVTATGQQADIGKFVRYRDGKGRVWSKFHLSEVKVKQGEAIMADCEAYKKAAVEWEQKARDRLTVIVEQQKQLEEKDKEILALKAQLAAGGGGDYTKVVVAGTDLYIKS